MTNPKIATESPSKSETNGRSAGEITNEERSLFSKMSLTQEKIFVRKLHQRKPINIAFVKNG